MSRIRIALGNLEVEYEGEQSFIEESLIELTERLVALSGISPSAAEAVSVALPSQSDSNSYSLDHSTNTIAQIISAKTGSDLALAAIVRLNLVKGRPSAPRADILDEMKQATTYYKDTYSSNLSAYLDTLVKARRVNLVARGTYALAASERSRLEPLISNGV